MVVDSKLELFTLLYGWLFYNSIWEVLVATGIVFLPFIGILLDTVASAYTSEDSDDAGNTSLRAMEIEFFIAFFVVLLSGVPAIPLTATSLSYTPRATIGNPAQLTATPANSQSTFGGSISFVDYPNQVDVPVFWYVILSFTSGFNRAVMEDIPPVVDLREYADDLRDLRINDPALQAELNDFYRDCFIEARSKYLEERPNSVAINNLLNHYGATDTEWLGSHVFLETTGYYDTLRSDAIREGFVYSQLRDLEWEPDDHPIYGKPSCREWWSHSALGIAAKIVSATDGVDLIAAAVEVGWDAQKRRDAIVQAVMLNSPARWTNRGYDLAYGMQAKFYIGEDAGYWGVLENRGMQALSGGGLVMNSLSFASWLRLFVEAAPMLQALILMGLYALLPFFILMSRYRISTFIIGALILFLVKFWTVLWFYAWWVDQNLIRAFYAEPGSITTLFNIDMTLKRAVLNVLTGLMYLVFPMLLTTYLAFSGIQAARGLDGISASAASRLDSASRFSGLRMLLMRGKGK